MGLVNSIFLETLTGSNSNEDVKMSTKEGAVAASSREIKKCCESAEMPTGSNGSDDAEALRQLSTVATLSSKVLSYWKERTRMGWRRWDGNDQIALVT